jgi:hypothetical protein
VPHERLHGCISRESERFAAVRRSAESRIARAQSVDARPSAQRSERRLRLDGQTWFDTAAGGLAKLQVVEQALLQRITKDADVRTMLGDALGKSKAEILSTTAASPRLCRAMTKSFILICCQA